MIRNCIRKRYSIYQLYSLIIALAVFATSGIVIWTFRDECSHFPIPPNEDRFIKCANKGLASDQKNVLRFQFTPVNNNEEYTSDSKPFHRGLRTAKEKGAREELTTEGVELLGKETVLAPATSPVEGDVDEKLVNVQKLNEIFRNRTKLSQKACSAYFYDEDSINFDTANSKEFISEMKKLERLERGENKVLMKTIPQKRTRWVFYTNSRRNAKAQIQWCPLYKSASTPWMAIFTKLAGALTEITSAKIHQGKITFMNLARDFRLFVPESQIGPTRRALPRYSMIVVRHPFKRLLSAYQDKIERVKGREYYYKMYGKKIVKNFRKKDQMKKSGTDMSLPDWYLMALSANREFLKEKSGVRREIAIQDPSGIQMNEEKGTTTVARFYVPRERGSEKKLLLKPAPETPTFLEFCKYLMTIDPRNMDEHWRPQSLDCSPCHHKFDLFLKVETLNEDRRAVFKVLGYENTTSVEYKELEETWKAWSNRSAKVHDEDFYFSQLSESLINNLYSLYELDFELFGYSADKYFDMVKK